MNELTEQFLAETGGPQSPHAADITAGDAIHDLFERAKKIDPVVGERLEKDMFEQALASPDPSILTRFAFAHMLEQQDQKPNAQS